MKKIILAALVFFSIGLHQTIQACDNSSFSISNTVNNPDGTITYTLDLFTDIGTADGNFYGFVLVFNSASNTPMPINYPATLAPGDQASGTLSETLTATTGNNINSIANESGWNAFENLPNALSYEYGGFTSAAPGDIGFSIDVTVDGCVESILFDAHTRRSPLCQRTSTTGVNCAICNITNVSNGNQSTCNSSNNTYSQEVIVTYSNPPSTGTLDVNGQSFAITSSPQTVTLTGLTADGNAVNGTVEFSDDTSCNNTVSFTAPASCNSSCNPDNGTWN